MPYVNVRLAGEVSAEKKRAVIKGITDVLVKELGKNPDTTFVVIDEVPTDNWGHKGTSISELRREAEAARPQLRRAVARDPAKRGATRKA